MGRNVIDIENAGAFASQEPLQPCFPLDQRQAPQVLAIQEEQVKCEQQAFAAPKEQVIEHRPPVLIDARDLAIKDSALDAEILAGPLGQAFEVAKRIAVSRDKLAFAVLDICERAEAIMFYLFCGVRCYVALQREPMIQMRRTDSDAT